MTRETAWPTSPLKRTAQAYSASWQSADATPSLIVGHARSIAAALDDGGPPDDCPSASAEAYQKLIALMMALESEEQLFHRYCADEDEGVARSFDAITRLLARSWVSVLDHHRRLCCQNDGERRFVLYAVRFLDGFWPSGAGATPIGPPRRYARRPRWVQTKPVRKTSSILSRPASAIFWPPWTAARLPRPAVK